jgi:hypothetical protein
VAEERAVAAAVRPRVASWLVPVPVPARARPVSAQLSPPSIEVS